MQDLQAVHSASFDMVDIAREMRREDTYVRDGHIARILIREADLRVILIALRTGAVMMEHEVAVTASVHALAGHVRLRLPDRAVELPVGRLLVLEPGLRHNVEALEESTLLLTLGWHAKS